MNDEKANPLKNQIEDLNKKLKAFEYNEKMFKALVETAVGNIGQDFFNNIVIKLSEWLNTECVIIGQIVGNNKVVAVPMFLDGKIVEDYSYDLNGTPCDLSMKKGYCNYSEDIINLFPEDTDLVGLNAEGYVGTALYNKEGQPNGILCAISRKKLQLPPQAEDILKIIGSRITAEIERIKSQEKIRSSEIQLKELNATKDKLFSIIAHDLKSPFNSILGFSTLLSNNIRTYPVEKSEEFIHHINSTTKQTLILLDTLLSWAKTQTGQIEYKPENLKLTPIFEEVVAGLNSSAITKDIALNYSGQDQVLVYADQNMLKTVLRNLVSNAIKFTDSGGRVEISAVSDQNQTEISISDNGVGMSEETISKLFRIDTTLTTKGTANESGSGLGLILCKEFVEKHQGKIWVESEVGKGSSFHFTIPYSTEPKEINVVSDLSGYSQIKNLKVLIAEDDETSRLLIANLVEMYSDNILCAKTGVEAIVACQKNPDIDLILMDVQMPEMGGYEATRQIRQFSKDVIIIAQTAFDGSSVKERAIEAGCNDYITKPINETLLTKLVKNHLTQRMVQTP